MAHDHNLCLQLAGDEHAAPKRSAAELEALASQEQNILMYARKSDDVNEILDALRDSVLYIQRTLLQEPSHRQTRKNIYLERWALEALLDHMSTSVHPAEVSFTKERRQIVMPGSKVTIKEWCPEGYPEDQLSVRSKDPQTGPRAASEKPKEHIAFEYVLCIGGDGTLLRLLRILFFRFTPSSLPRIITLSMGGSLGYLCNFNTKDLLKVLDSTILVHHAPKSPAARPPREIKINYRSRLSCQIEDVENSQPVPWRRTFVDSQGGSEVQPAVCHALNEISITRGNAEFMCRFDIYINDTLLTIAQGDGVLISTPTGSTAYNLSCGGSIIHATSDVVALTPICPHSLSFRPIILPKTAKISIVLPEEARTGAWVTFDG